MTDTSHSRDSDERQRDLNESHGPQERAPLSRRRFVTGAIATAPILATLPSGAALARSSNVITAASSTAKDKYDRTLCLDTRSGYGQTAGGVDLGQPPSGAAVAIRSRDWRADDSLTAAEVSESDMCNQGGYYYYRTWTGWNKASVRPGMVVSYTAMASFAGSIRVTEI